MTENYQTKLVSRKRFLKQSGMLSLPFIPGFESLVNAFSFDKAELTVQQVIDKVLASVPGVHIANTVDTVKYGDPNQVVTGIVTTMFATDEVIEAAAKMGANFIIVHEPTFYNHVDDTKWLENDPVFVFKAALLKKYKIAVWRYHDYIHSHVPDGVLVGVMEAVGWKKYYDVKIPNVFTIPGKKLSSIITDLKKSLKIEHVKYIGDDDMICSKIGLLPGAAGGMKQIALIKDNNPDVLIVGELNEWETSEYVRDLRASGKKNCLIVLGHIQSEEPGSEWLSDWIRKNISGIKVTHIPSNDAFKWK